MQISEQEAIHRLTYKEYDFSQRVVDKLPPISRGVLSLETPLEAWNRYVDICLTEVLEYLEKL